MDTAKLTRALFFWQYGQSLIDMFAIWKNFLLTTVRIFSVPDLLRTLFSPWRRLNEPYQTRPGVIDFGQIASAFLINILMRLIGLFVRLIFIAFFLIVFTFVFIAGLIVFILWTFLPLVLIGSFGLGIALLFFL